LIERALQFANLKLPGEAGQAVELWRQVCTRAESTPLNELTNDHVDLNKWLMKITGRRIIKGRRQFVWRLDTLAEVLKLAEHCVVEIHPRYEKASKLHERFSITAPSVEAAYAYAVGLLIDRKKRWARLVRRCEWQDCRRFFLSKAIRGGGGGERMCSEACRRAAKSWSSKKSPSS
jgi:hypothetical protein